MRLEPRRRLVLSLGLAVALSVGTVLPIGAAPASPPSTLSGEQLAAPLGNNSGVCGGFNSGPLSFSITGTATGPYTGTFSEQGSATVSYTSLTAFDATFTITSGTTTVTGSKKFRQSGPSCYQDATHWIINVVAAYEATIHTPTGNYLDRGTTVTNAEEDGSANPISLEERFTSSAAQPTLIVPTSKDQCKNGGWKNYPQFKNQGQCVSFVENNNDNDNNANNNNK